LEGKSLLVLPAELLNIDKDKDCEHSPAPVKTLTELYGDVVQILSLLHKECNERRHFFLDFKAELSSPTEFETKPL